ncbi:MAG: response regulator [Pirellulales bacterium]
MISVEPTVYVIDDDQDVREAIEWTAKTVGLNVASFASPSDFFAAFEPESPGCIVIDLRLPEMSGLQLQAQLAQRGSMHPFIVISGHGDVPIAVEAMRQGAMDFLEKPYPRQRLLDAIQAALGADAKLREEMREEKRVAAKLALLTARERQILDFVSSGLLTKQIAAELGLSPKTVEVHRSRIMSNLDVDSIVQLTKLLVTDLRRQGREAKARLRSPQHA